MLGGAPEAHNVLSKTPRIDIFPTRSVLPEAFPIKASDHPGTGWVCVPFTTDPLQHRTQSFVPSGSHHRQCNIHGQIVYAIVFRTPRDRRASIRAYGNNRDVWAPLLLSPSATQQLAHIEYRNRR